ncbi:hypothetical protein BHE74_00032271 [Ensete ventricosum]|nr:hypothetical protein GW17_00008618 [Ensete ventricosum]RWW60713.1 hypothetical protein BHE74_00032271 [Ensete ventricosum]
MANKTICMVVVVVAKTENDSDAAVESARGWSCMVAASVEKAGASDGGVASMAGKDGGSVVENCKPAAAELGACEQEARDNHVTAVAGAGHAAAGKVRSSTEGGLRERLGDGGGRCDGVVRRSGSTVRRERDHESDAEGEEGPQSHRSTRSTATTTHGYRSGRGRRCEINTLLLACLYIQESFAWGGRRGRVGEDITHLTCPP